jgi:hypothetical protein
MPISNLKSKIDDLIRNEMSKIQEEAQGAYSKYLKDIKSTQSPPISLKVFTEQFVASRTESIIKAVLKTEYKEYVGPLYRNYLSKQGKIETFVNHQIRQHQQKMIKVGRQQYINDHKQIQSIQNPSIFSGTRSNDRKLSEPAYEHLQKLFNNCEFPIQYEGKKHELEKEMEFLISMQHGHKVSSKDLVDRFIKLEEKLLEYQFDNSEELKEQVKNQHPLPVEALYQRVENTVQKSLDAWAAAFATEVLLKSKHELSFSQFKTSDDQRSLLDYIPSIAEHQLSNQYYSSVGTLPPEVSEEIEFRMAEEKLLIALEAHISALQAEVEKLQQQQQKQDDRDLLSKESDSSDISSLTQSSLESFASGITSFFSSFLPVENSSLNGQNVKNIPSRLEQQLDQLFQFIAIRNELEPDYSISSSHSQSSLSSAKSSVSSALKDLMSDRSFSSGASASSAKSLSSALSEYEAMMSAEKYRFKRKKQKNNEAYKTTLERVSEIESEKNKNSTARLILTEALKKLGPAPSEGLEKNAKYLVNPKKDPDSVQKITLYNSTASQLKAEIGVLKKQNNQLNALRNRLKPN